MQKERGITLITLVITIIVLMILAGVSVNTLMGEDGIIKKAKEAKANIIIAGEEEAKQLNQLYYELEIGGELTEGEEIEKKDEMIELLETQVNKLQQQVSELQTENDSLNEEINNLNAQITELEEEIADLKTQVEDDDIEIADLLNQVSDKQATIDSLQSQLDNLNATLAETTATADKILKGYTAYSGGQLITGSMTNNGAVSSTLNCGASYTIPAGYHNGSGKVTANSLASQTQATATANNLSKGVTAWVNGAKITGNGTDVTNSYNSGYEEGKEEGSEITKIASLSSEWEGSYAEAYTIPNYNAKSIDGYQNLTKENFLPVVTYVHVHNTSNKQGNDATGSFDFSYSYNASTGTLSFSNYGFTIYNNGNQIAVSLKIDLYLVK